MKISTPVTTLTAAGAHRVEVLAGDFDLWFEGSPGTVMTPTGEALVCAALLPAMARGEDLELPADYPIDATFLGHLDQIQEIFLAWQDTLRVRLRRATIHAAIRSSPPKATEGVLSFFSGGVDGSYTAMRHRDRITTAVLLRGIDMQLENADLWTSAHASAERLAVHFGIPLVTVATNIRFFGYESGLKWASHYQGAGLAAIGHLMGHAEVLVAATSALDELTPYGSHPLTDPLWSSDAIRFVHEGAVPRTEKLRAIAADPVIMSVLRVCWHDSGYNCGRCGKCLRTRVALHLLGVDAPTFPGRLDWRAVGQIRLGDPSEWSFFKGLEQLEHERPDRDARAALARIRRNSLLTSALRQLDDAAGAPVARLKAAIRGGRA